MTGFLGFGVESGPGPPAGSRSCVGFRSPEPQTPEALQSLKPASSWGGVVWCLWVFEVCGCGQVFITVHGGFPKQGTPKKVP